MATGGIFQPFNSQIQESKYLSLLAIFLLLSQIHVSRTAYYYRQYDRTEWTQGWAELPRGRYATSRCSQPDLQADRLGKVKFKYVPWTNADTK